MTGTEETERTEDLMTAESQTSRSHFWYFSANDEAQR
jgi:hypothetical protein